MFEFFLVYLIYIDVHLQSVFNHNKFFYGTKKTCFSYAVSSVINKGLI